MFNRKLKLDVAMVKEVLHDIQLHLMVLTNKLGLSVAELNRLKKDRVAANKYYREQLEVESVNIMDNAKTPEEVALAAKVREAIVKITNENHE